METDARKLGELTPDGGESGRWNHVRGGQLAASWRPAGGQLGVGFLSGSLFGLSKSPGLACGQRSMLPVQSASHNPSPVVLSRVCRAFQARKGRAR